MGRIRSELMVVLLALAACDHNPPLPGDRPVPPVPPTTPPVPPTPSCQPQPIVPQRIERLTLLQETNAVSALLSREVADALVTQLGLGDPGNEVFPPLESTREGDTIIPRASTPSTRSPQPAASTSSIISADLSGCDADVDCARAFVTAFHGRRGSLAENRAEPHLHRLPHAKLPARRIADAPDAAGTGQLRGERHRQSLCRGPGPDVRGADPRGRSLARDDPAARRALVTATAATSGSATSHSPATEATPAIAHGIGPVVSLTTQASLFRVNPYKSGKSVKKRFRARGSCVNEHFHG